MDRIIRKAVFYCDADKKIRKKNIQQAVHFYYHHLWKKNNNYKGKGGDYLQPSFEPNFCGFHVTQCYSPPKPCVGCHLQGGGSYSEAIKKSIRKRMKKKYPNYKITHHALHYFSHFIQFHS